MVKKEKNAFSENKNISFQYFSCICSHGRMCVYGRHGRYRTPTIQELKVYGKRIPRIPLIVNVWAYCRIFSFSAKEQIALAIPCRKGV